MAGDVTHEDLGRLWEKYHEVDGRVDAVKGTIDSHEAACIERWKNNDAAWARQATSNTLLESVNLKVTYWSGGLGLLGILLGIAGTILAGWLVK